jgi:pyrimidine deaminase RibD-like protein
MDPEKIRSACFLAISLAEKSKKAAEHNKEVHPAVGAVILDRHGKILAQGYRKEDAPRDEKGSHAEVVALNKLDERTKERADTLVTTLEPCSIRRNQDAIPCSRRIVRAGIRRVLIGCLDPGVGVRGHGAQLLQDRGLYFNMFPEAPANLVRSYNDEYLESCKKRFVKPDLIPPFDLAKAPRESLRFLQSKTFQNFAAEIYRNYKKDSDRKLVAWEDYFAANSIGADILEEERTKSAEATVFEELASYLAISPNDPNEQIAVYQRVGEWLMDEKRLALK